MVIWQNLKYIWVNKAQFNIATNIGRKGCSFESDAFAILWDAILPLPTPNSCDFA